MPLEHVGTRWNNSRLEVSSLLAVAFMMVHRKLGIDQKAWNIAHFYQLQPFG